MKQSNPYAMLALAVKVAITDRDVETAIKLIDATRLIESDEDDELVGWMAMAATEQVCLVLLAEGVKKAPKAHSEYGFIQSWFKKNHAGIFPGSSLEKVQAGRYVPDFMIRTASGDVVPVECKKTFNARSLRQLQAYMDHFCAKSGVAVAAKLSVELPANVTFVLRPQD